MYNAGGNKESQLVGDTVRRVRQNHALEHATIAVLQESGVRLPLAGYSTSGGFFIFGKASTEAITALPTMHFPGWMQASGSSLSRPTVVRTWLPERCWPQSCPPC